MIFFLFSDHDSLVNQLAILFPEARPDIGGHPGAFPASPVRLFSLEATSQPSLIETDPDHQLWIECSFFIFDNVAGFLKKK